MNPPPHDEPDSALPIGRQAWATALALTVGTTVLLAWTDQMGFTRDESFYFRAAREYAGWFEGLWGNLWAGRPGASFTRAAVDAHWGYNPEHPVLMKSLFALSHLVLHERLGWLGPSLAMRLPAMAMGGLAVGLTWLMTFELSRRVWAAWIAALLLLAQPHFFFHAHLTCFDIPIVTCWLAVIWAWRRSLTSHAWAVGTGLLWGVALTCKLNAFFLPVLLVAHWCVTALPQVRRVGGRLHFPPVPAALFWMALLGPLVLYWGWPRHWYDTWERLTWYLNFHLRHEHYYVAYFGQHLIRPPFPAAYPFVLTAVTTPLLILWCLGVGVVWHLVQWVRQRPMPWQGTTSGGMGWMLALNIALPFLIIARPSTPVFGGVKHWLTAMPFLCMLGGMAFEAVARQVGDRRVSHGLCAVVVALVVGHGWTTNRAVHPFGLSYYNELVGGVAGAADRGMMRQFWGYASRQALPWIEANAPRGARIYWHDTTGYSVDMYRREGWLREDLQVTGRIDQADVVVWDHDAGFVEHQTQVWTLWGTMAPAHVVSVQGVPLVSVYLHPRHRGAGGPGGLAPLLRDPQQGGAGEAP